MPLALIQVIIDLRAIIIEVSFVTFTHHLLMHFDPILKPPLLLATLINTVELGPRSELPSKKIRYSKRRLV
jgi:hypothetical protein